MASAYGEHTTGTPTQRYSSRSHRWHLQTACDDPWPERLSQRGAFGGCERHGRPRHFANSRLKHRAACALSTPRSFSA